MSIYWKVHNFIRDSFFNPIWFSVFGHKHHIVKTKLTPAPWYDVDTRMLYSVMALVEWHVKNDMQLWSDVERKSEIDRIKNDGRNEDDNLFGSRKTELDIINEQFKNQDDILSIYGWWKNYENRQKEISESLHNWHEYVESSNKDKGDVVSFFDALSTMKDDQKKEEARLNKIMSDLERKLSEEEQSMLKKAVELRYSMWS